MGCGHRYLKVGSTKHEKMHFVEIIYATDSPERELILLVPV